MVASEVERKCGRVNGGRKVVCVYSSSAAVRGTFGRFVYARGLGGESRTSEEVVEIVYGLARLWRC